MPAKLNTHIDESNATGRERLLRAGLKLFAQQGFDGTSVREIAAEAGVSFGLIRKYFGSKEGLRDEVESRVIGELQTFYANNFPGTPGSEDSVAEGAVAFLAEDQDVLVYLRFALMHPGEGTDKLLRRYFEMFAGVVTRLKAEGQINPRADERWAAYLLMFMQLGPLMLEPFSDALFGKSIYAPELLRDRQRAYLQILSEPLLQSGPQ